MAGVPILFNAKVICFPRNRLFDFVKGSISIWKFISQSNHGFWLALTYMEAE